MDENVNKLKSPIKVRVSDIITCKEIEGWNNSQVVLISAGTGVGKSFFIKNTLYDFAKGHNQKILMFLHRTNCVDQFVDEVERAGKNDIVDIITYQKLENGILDISKKMKYDTSEYQYLVSDEFHYFFNDSSFNNHTIVSFNAIMNTENAVKIFMSATGQNMEEYMTEYIKKNDMDPMIKYTIPVNFDFIKSLTFFNDRKAIEEVLIKKFFVNREKAIIFMQSAEKAYNLYKKYQKVATFNCGSSSKYYKHVDHDEIKKVLQTQRFETPLLITTGCFDAGINIIDSDLKHIVVDITDIDSLIQCIGRKRLQPGDDKVNVYIKTIHNQQLAGLMTKAKKQIEMAEVLRNSDYSADIYTSSFPMTSDKTDIVYDVAVNSNDGTLYRKEINEIALFKRKKNIELYDKLIHGYDKFGYCKYLAYIFGFDGRSPDKCYRIMDERFSIIDYLADHEGEVMLQRTDRKELIRKMDVKRDRKLKSNINTLNAVLEEDGIPFKIEEFRTTKVIDGRKNDYKHAWRIIKHIWSEDDVAV